MLSHIRIVLINTSHPGNIGSVARAMKTMGLTRLYLVDPKEFPSPKADELAASAVDILANAVVTQTLDEAIADCTRVIGTSARNRAIPWPLQTPREMALSLKTEPTSSETAILFGRERTGLTNEELHLCHSHVHIPANPEYSSLNLAAAVQVLSYEIYQASLDHEAQEESDYRLATAEEMERYFEHLKTVLIDLDFLKASAPRQLMTRLRRLYLKARPDVMEMNILRGILTAISKGK